MILFGSFHRIDATKMEVITKNDDKLEISFSKPWNKFVVNSLPINIDKRFVVKKKKRFRNKNLLFLAMSLIRFYLTLIPKKKKMLIIYIHIYFYFRFVMLRNSSGFYTYAIFERLKGWPAVELDNIRVAFRLNKEKYVFYFIFSLILFLFCFKHKNIFFFFSCCCYVRFNYMAIADDRQRYMSLPEDQFPPRGQTLGYPEAVRLINPIEPQFKGEV